MLGKNTFVCPVNELSDSLVQTWRALSETADASPSPFMHPSYARMVSRVRPGVEVAVITSDGEPVGFMPFERASLGFGRSVGARLCDRSGAVVREGVTWSVVDTARDAGLTVLRLSNVPTDDEVFRPYLTGSVIAPYIDVSDGYEAYRKANVDAGGGTMKRLARRGRKLENMCGPLRVEWHVRHDGVLDTLLRWKAIQRQKTRSPNVFDLPWARRLLGALRGPDLDGFGGVLSALYAGDTLCAAHFGIRTGKVLHYWLAAYNEEFHRCSPGLLLITEMARECAERGIDRLDLGPGEEGYKLTLASGHQNMAVATACSQPSMSGVVRAAEQMRVRARRSRVGDTLRALRRNLVRGTYLMRSGGKEAQAEVQPDDA